MKKIWLIIFVASFPLLFFSQASLPVSRTTWSATPTGWSDNQGTSPTYGSDLPCGGTDVTSGRLDATGENFVVNYNGSASSLSFCVKGNPSSGSNIAGTFDVLESPDGATWSTVQSYVNLSNVSSTESLTLLCASRYVKFIYTSKTSGNIQLDGVSVATGTCSCSTSEPTTQISASSASSIACTSFTLGWTNGDGTNRLVVIRAGSAPSAAPADLTSYTANAAFGSGTALGNGFVVYNGTGNTVNITGLTNGTTYYWATYEFNGSGGCENYLTSSTSSGNVTVTTAEPATQASASSATATCSSIAISWTSGNGSNRIVVLQDGSAPAAPVDYTNYTASTTFGSGTAIGSGFVVYNGTGNTVTISGGLTNGHTYYWAIYEFNGSGGCQNYLTSSTSSGSVTVTTAEPATPATASVGTATCSTNSMDISWTSGNGSGRIVVLQDGSAPTAPTDYTVYSASSTFGSGTAIGSGFVVYNFTGTSVHVTNLTAGHTYYWAIYEYNGSMAGGCANFLTASPASGNVTPGNSEPTSPSTASSASAVTCNSMTLNLTKGNGANRLIVVKAGSAPTGPTDYTSYTASTVFGSGTNIAASSSYVVYNGTATGAGVVTVTGLTNNTTYYWAIYEFNGSGSCANFLTSSFEAGSVLIATTEPTTQASVSSASPVGCTSFTLSWTSGNGSNRIVVLKDGSAPTAPTDLSSYTASSVFASGNTTAALSYVVYNGTGNSVSITGLTSTHTYYWAVYEYNGSGTCANYLTSSSASGNATTASSDPEPTVQVSPSASSNIGCNSFLLSWTSGNGAGRLVVLKSGAAVTAPTDGTTYTANSSFGSGTALGGGNVVYAGSGSSVFITSLSASTTYYWGVYEYNGSGTCINYLTSSVASGSITTNACSSPIGVTGIYIDACSGTCGYEGNNEMVWGTTGSYGMSVSNNGPTLYYDAVTPPTTTYISTYSQYSSNINALNTAVGSCGTTTFVDPNTQGYIPANSRFLIAHSCLCDPLAYDMSNLCGSGPIYVVFGNNAAWPCGSGSGIFGNGSACNGSTRYIKVDFNTWGINSAPIYNYDPCSESGSDGDYGLFDPAGGAITTYGSNSSCAVPLIILPIELIQFTAVPFNNKINIEWKTSSEKNLERYNVEKSYDGTNFFIMKNINPTNNISGAEYFTTDFSPSPVLNYYRLKTIEFNGDAHYSNMVTVSLEKNKTVQVYLYDGDLFVNIPIEIKDAAAIQICDLAGKTVFQKKLSSKNEIINAASFNLSGGVYFATIIKNNSILITQKIVIP